MKERFRIKFLKSAADFMVEIDKRASAKLFYKIERAKLENDPKAFKKLDDAIWEFRTESKNVQYRLLAFWDNRNNTRTLVVCTRGFIKKTDKVEARELKRARFLMNNYFNINEKES